MTRKLLLTLTFLLTKSIICQVNNEVLIGELTLTQSKLDKVKIGDTLTFLLAKKPFEGSIKIHSDNAIYSWTSCVLNQNKYSWCKIGTWEKKNFIILRLYCKTIILKNISTDIGLGQQKLVVQDIK